MPIRQPVPLKINHQTSTSIDLTDSAPSRLKEQWYKLEGEANPSGTLKNWLTKAEKRLNLGMSTVRLSWPASVSDFEALVSQFKSVV